MKGDAPEPLSGEELAPALTALDAGAGFKDVLEELVRSIPLERAELLMLLLREGRGTWQLLLEAGGGHALVCGNALSGTIPAFLAGGFAVTAYDSSPGRLAFAAHRARQWTDGTLEVVRDEGTPTLPFETHAFDLVVAEEGAPSTSADRTHPLAECRRVARGELVLVCENRLGYKRSRGWRGRFEVPPPHRWIADALRATGGERTLVGWRRALRCAGGGEPEAWSLYPTALDFTFVAGIDEEWPALYVGPKERQNPLKVLGERAGLFGALAPSFLLRSRRADAPVVPRRIGRVLDALAERIGEPAGHAEHLVATRGNSAVVLCRGDAEPGGPGDWCLHLPLSRQQRRQLERHHDVLERLPREHPGVPAPAPLFRGELEGLWLSVERRLPGLGAPQIAGEREPIARMLREVAEVTTLLVVERDVLLDEEAFERLVAARFALVRGFVAEARVERTLDRMLAESRERMLGRRVPLVLHHADLRSKHVQVRPDGSLLGLFDWGSSTDRDLPWFDLLHLVVHERKQAEGLTPGAAWRLLLGEGGGLREVERAPLETHARALGLDPEVREALERVYPVLVAAMAEANWDFSRPRWLERMFRIADS